MRVKNRSTRLGAEPRSGRPPAGAPSGRGAPPAGAPGDRSAPLAGPRPFAHVRVAVSSVPRTVPTGYGPDAADTAAKGLVDGVLAAGGTPIVLPVVPPALAADQLAGADALVLAGGQDLALDAAGAWEPGARATAERWIDPARDRHELALWQAAAARALPVLAICRGMQLVNVALGGTLVRHLDGHDAGAGHRDALHEVVLEGDLLPAPAGARTLPVNTIHHQAIDAPGRGLHVAARAGDGVIEAVALAPEEAGLPPELWCRGVQWHPELLLDLPAGQPLFDALVAQAARRRAAAGAAQPPSSETL